MIVLETSALVAMVAREPGSERLLAVAAAEGAALPAHCLLEAHMVLASRFPPGMIATLDAVVARLAPVVLPFDARHADAAREAYLRYGKGRHPAALNFGDCMSYAVAKVEGLPLLWVGDDFGRTDAVPA